MSDHTAFLAELRDLCNRHRVRIWGDTDGGVFASSLEPGERIAEIVESPYYGLSFKMADPLVPVGRAVTVRARDPNAKPMTIKFKFAGRVDGERANG